jgi:hypothetical protein
VTLGQKWNAANGDALAISIQEQERSISLVNPKKTIKQKNIYFSAAYIKN